MSTSLWRWIPACDKRSCPGDCDLCSWSRIREEHIDLQEELGMTDQEIIDEIRLMRDFDKALQEELGMEEYMRISVKACRKRAKEELLSLGATEEEAERICDEVEQIPLG